MNNSFRRALAVIAMIFAASMALPGSMQASIPDNSVYHPKKVLQAVSGKITDEGGNPISYATVQLFPSGSSLARYSAITDDEGSFLLKNVATGQYDVFVSHVAFGSRSVFIRVGAEPVVMDLTLLQGVLSQGEVVISSGRARMRLSPVTVSNITALELAEQPDMKDLPVHLARQPGITYYSENGNAIGYSTLRMRGFDQRRLAVAINGIPQNDPEEFNVFWINFFDIQGAVQDIQIQRGAGSSVYGSTAIGGAINLRAMPYKSDFEASVHVGGGAFGTRRISGEVNTGLLADRYVVYGRLSRLTSDGYRDWSWTEFWRFFAGITRYGERSSLTLQAYGGPQRDGLAYSGIPKAANTQTLDDGFGGTIDRKYNYSSFDRDVEDFHQPHVEMHHEWDVSDRLTFNQTAFWVKGEGYFDFGGTFRSADYLRLPESIVSGEARELPLFLSRPDVGVLFRAYLDQWQVGWMPRLTSTSSNATTTIGGELRLHRSLRWGRIQDGSGLPEDLVGSAADARVYSVRGEKKIASLYASRLQRFSDDWAAQADVQVTWRQYRTYDEAFFGTELSTPFAFVNPRLGVTWKPEEPFSAFASVALAHREPRMKTLYDGEEAGAGFQPQFRSRSDGSFDTSDPLVKPERLVDVELGASLKGARHRVSANLFVMDFRDEIVPSGGLDQYGVPRTGNADHTRHSGIELDAALEVRYGVAVSGNATFSRNRFLSFDEFVGASTTGAITLDREGNTIAGFPGRNGNLRADWKRGDWRASVMASWVGKQYIDNGNGRDATGAKQDDLFVDQYMLVDASLAWSTGSRTRLQLALDANNVFNDRVLSWGNVSVTGPQFFPAATRHLFLSAKVTFR